MKNMTYEELVKKGIIVCTNENNDMIVYRFEERNYLVQSGKIIKSSPNLNIYENGDYRYLNEHNRFVLKRGNRILYEADPEHEIKSLNCFDKNNTKYKIVDRALWDTVMALDFPFNTEHSILDIIDAKIKEEHDRLSRSGEKR